MLRGNALRIKLGHSGEADTKPTIRPGMVLYGEVCYKPTDRETLCALTVNLLGNSAVKASKGRRELTQLFSVQHPILRREDDPIGLEVKEYKFAFHFVVPLVTEYDRTGMFREDDRDLFTDRPHRVPPSLGSKGKGDARIVYSVSAVIRKRAWQSLTFNSMDHSVLGVELEDIRCVVEQPDVLSEVLARIQRGFVPPAVKQGLFRRSSAVDAFTAGGKCAVTFSGSSVLVLGEAYNLRCEVEYADPSLLQNGSTMWKLSIKSVDLIATTHRRFKCGDVFSEEECFPIKWPTKSLPLRHGEPLSRPIVVDRTNLDIVSSFKSYSVARTYVLRITVCNSMGNGKTSTQQLQGIELSVGVFRRGDDMSRRASSYVPQDVNGRLVEPPAYEDSPAYD